VPSFDPEQPFPPQPFHGKAAIIIGLTGSWNSHREKTENDFMDNSGKPILTYIVKVFSMPMDGTTE
jgi:hypothetical protein